MDKFNHSKICSHNLHSYIIWGTKDNASVEHYHSMGKEHIIGWLNLTTPILDNGKEWVYIILNTKDTASVEHQQSIGKEQIK